MKNKYPIEYLPIAEKDLLEILEYIHNDNSSATLQFLEEIDKVISELAYFPYMGYIPKDQRLIQLNYRTLVVENCRVFYVVLDEIIEIRRILHGKRKYDFLA